MVAKVLIKEMYRLKQMGDGRESSFLLNSSSLSIQSSSSRPLMPSFSGVKESSFSSTQCTEEGPGRKTLMYRLQSS